jgi:hypothetical protein
MQRRPNTQNVQWFLTHFGSGQLVLDPPFQRRSVWSLDYKRSFVDTVLRDYPCPPIFLQEDTEPGRPTTWNVIDGKQRLSALIDFTNNEFHLGRYMAEEGLEDSFWSDLNTDLQRTFSRYVLTVENIYETNESELREVFNRLNRNVDRLTAQELRHAQFPGVFLERMEALAEAPFWTARGIATPAAIRRMRDVELVSELFLLTMHGILDGKAEVIDQYYALYADEIPAENEHRTAYDSILRYLEDLPLEWKATRWSNVNDLYALWGAVRLAHSANAFPATDVAASRLTEFSEMQAAIAAAAKARTPLPGEDRDRRYYDAIRQGSNKENNRQESIRIVSELLAE